MGTTTDTGRFTPTEVVGHEAWGRLVMSWSTGKDFVSGDGKDAHAGPPGAPVTVTDATIVTRAEFDNAMISSGATVRLPPRVEEVVFVKDTPTRRYIRLPEGAMVLAARDELIAGDSYSLPAFYTDSPLDCADPSDLPLDERLRLQAERVGDYSISSCM